MVMRYTDADVPITCWECPETDFQKDIGCAEGLEAMEQHILEHHKNYTPDEAKKFAQIWMEGAFERLEEASAEYYKQRKEDPSQ